MMVRLAFAVMVEADADIMLVDEVLAVGDAAFAQKCMDVFRAKRRAGQDARARHPRHGDGRRASATGRCCIHDGELRYLGDPEEAALRYYRLNFARRHGARRGRAGRRAGRQRARRRRVARGRRRRARRQRRAGRRRSACSVVLEARRDLEAPVFGFHFVNGDGQRGLRLQPDADARRRASPTACRRASASGSAGTIENPLLPGRYFVDCCVARNRDAGRPRAAPAAAARLRRLRDAARRRAASSVRRRRRGGRSSA